MTARRRRVEAPAAGAPLGRTVALVDATTSTTTAMTLLSWMRHRDQFTLIADEPELAARTVEESLRLHPVGLFVFPRFSVSETELGGTRIPAGLPVHICVAAADLDPEVYPDPLRFDIRRGPKHIMVFGRGHTSARAASWLATSSPRPCAG